jgi:drug/metabolite transporter (DMT)-like permease
MRTRLPGILLAMVAAASYGASFPLTKGIQDAGVSPLILAGFFYLSQAVAFFLVRLVLPAHESRRLRGGDLKWMGGAILFGGLLGPALFLYGQERIPAYAGALLSPTEILFTTLVAVLFFRERLTGGEVMAIALVMIGAVLVGLKLDNSSQPMTLGALLVVASFLMWGIDNNCTTRISERDPFLIAMYKGLVGGAFNMAAGSMTETGFPVRWEIGAQIVFTGIACYGASYAIFILAMRKLGASRSAAIFGTNPAFGVALAWALRDEQPALWALGGGAMMVAGVVLLSMFRKG